MTHEELYEKCKGKSEEEAMALVEEYIMDRLASQLEDDEWPDFKKAKELMETNPEEGFEKMKDMALNEHNSWAVDFLSCMHLKNALFWFQQTPEHNLYYSGLAKILKNDVDGGVKDLKRAANKGDVIARKLIKAIKRLRD